jgi:hypothetical protein
VCSLRGTSLMFTYNLLIFAFKAFSTKNFLARLAILAVNICRKVRGPETTHAVVLCALLGCNAASSGNPLPTFRETSHLEGSRSPLLFWTRPLKMGPICCPETSVKDYHSTLRYTPEGRRSHQHRGGSLKSRAVLRCLFRSLWQNKGLSNTNKCTTLCSIRTIFYTVLTCFGLSIHHLQGAGTKVPIKLSTTKEVTISVHTLWCQ